MVLKPSLAAAIALALFTACLGSAPPARQPNATPIALHLYLESARGEPKAVPGAVLAELRGALAARNLEVVAPEVAAGAFETARTTPARLEALARASEAPWILLIEARARFFSQLSGRYRWEVELRTSLAPRAQLTEAQHSDLGVAAFLLYEHESEREALAFVRRQLVGDVTALVDRVLSTP